MAESMEQSMGERVKSLRKSHCWTQAELAERSGLSRVAISLIETGKSECMLTGTIKALARALEVPAEDLFFARSVNTY